MASNRLLGSLMHFLCVSSVVFSSGCTCFCCSDPVSFFVMATRAFVQSSRLLISAMGLGVVVYLRFVPSFVSQQVQQQIREGLTILFDSFSICDVTSQLFVWVAIIVCVLHLVFKRESNWFWTSIGSMKWETELSQADSMNALSKRNAYRRQLLPEFRKTTDHRNPILLRSELYSITCFRTIPMLYHCIGTWSMCRTSLKHPFQTRFNEWLSWLPSTFRVCQDQTVACFLFGVPGQSNTALTVSDAKTCNGCLGFALPFCVLFSRHGNHYCFPLACHGTQT